MDVVPIAANPSHGFAPGMIDPAGRMPYRERQGLRRSARAEAGAAGRKLQRDLVAIGDLFLRLQAGFR